MKRILPIVIFAVITASFSCTNTNKNAGTIPFKERDAQTLEPATRKVLFFPPRRMSPTKIYVADSLLFFIETSSSRFIQVFNLKTNKLITGTGLKSNENNGLVSCWELSFNKSGRCFWVDDLVAKKLAAFSIDSLLADKNYMPKRIIHLDKSAQLCYFPTLLNDTSTSFVSSDYTGYNKRRLFYINQQGTVYKTAGSLPTAQKDVSLPIISQSFQAVAAVQPENSRIVLADFYSDKIEVFDTEGRKMFYISGPEQFEPEFTVSHVYNTDMLNLERSTEIAYVDVRTTPDYIYALYSGREVQDKDFTSGSVIYVFDWKGAVKYKIQLAKPAVSFCLNSESKTIYTIGIDGLIMQYTF